MKTLSASLYFLNYLWKEIQWNSKGAGLCAEENSLTHSQPLSVLWLQASFCGLIILNVGQKQRGYKKWAQETNCGVISRI